MPSEESIACKFIAPYCTPAQSEGDVVLFQVGCFFEFYDERDDEIARLLDLTPIGANPRGGRYGFPFRLTARYLRKLLRAGRLQFSSQPDFVGSANSCRC
jgi:DNA mismatch repair ATPase MutS